MVEVTLVACPLCHRNNNSQRLLCIYCGGQLPVIEGSEFHKLPVVRPMEETELGVNLIFFPEESLVDQHTRHEIESVSRLSAELVDLYLQVKSPIPLLRLQDETDASLTRHRLLAAGVRTAMIPDADLTLKQLPHRIRQVVWQSDSLDLWGADQTLLARLPWSTVTLLVFGALRFKQTQVIEANNVYGRGREIKDVSENVTEELTIDLFGGNLQHHFRIRSDSFDYSCLGNRKRLLVAENFREFCTMLTERATQATIDRGFRQVTRLIEPVWPLEKSTERLPLKRIGVGKVTSESVVLADNQAQLTRYSRMLFLLRSRQIWQPSGMKNEE